MRPWSLILAVLVTGCVVPLPQAPGVKIDLRAKVRADVHVQVPTPAVAIQGAAVVEFFGIPLDDAQDVVFVLDVSGSMSEQSQGVIAGVGATKIDVAHQELIEALQRLPAGTRLNVVFFESDVEAFAPQLVTLDDADRDQLIAYVSATAATGSTALAPAMRTAFLMNAKRVVLLSDGLGNVGGSSRDVLRDAREAMLGGVRIDTIGLGKGQDANLLGSLASESGGIYQAL